jgi:hypothetical protein
MRLHSRVGGVLLLAALAATATGCQPSTPSADPGPSLGSTAQANSPAASPKPAPVSLPENGKCVLITAQKASELLHGTATGTSANHADDAEIKHIDGCAYKAAAANLGYDINEFSTSGANPTAIIAQAKTAMAGQPGAKAFTVSGGDSSLAFTATIGGKVMARIECAKDNYVIAVNAVAASDADAKQIATAALDLLVAAVG